MTMGLGSEYYSGSGNGNYRLQLAFNRCNEPYLSMRRMEGGGWSGWQRVYAGRADSIIASGYAEGNFGVGNIAPINIGSGYYNLHIGRCANSSYSRGYMTISQDFNNGSIRQCRQGYNDIFYYCIGDYGATNTSSSTWTPQFMLYYSAPSSSFFIGSSGYCYMSYGYGTSDQSIKYNIKTIDNALFKVLNLRGVEYNDIREGTRHIGLIAQEVEGVIPEAVSTNEMNNIKAVAYGNMAGLFVNAFKEMNEIILNQQKTINNLINRIEALENGLK